ncbi:ThuA domain-containing protein [Luteolibacter arcticus]|uniref:ThuA domain-containing protein n=1 Tax=Luteolibacter arcticus TaxID=1581411 RepID=A0ABT3GJT8_9BACT|nr:ThuA domain-containing protein [Luteolibacter arcticus]MCW1923762.1 ThuA domain-containing protein [Luteolibacter arcticus]
MVSPRILFSALLLLVSTAFAERPKVLLIEGASNHDWQNRKDILTAILSRDGSFDVDVSITPGAASDPGWATWSPSFANYDVVISGYSNSAGGEPRWPAAVETAFANYVNTGGGFVAFHEACQAFPDWPAYNEMLGLRWNNADVGKTILISASEQLQIHNPNLPGPYAFTNHGANVNVQVKRLGNHPIHAGLPTSWMAANMEIWRYTRGPANNLTVLSYAKDPESLFQFPVEWTTNYGTGRVYASSYGHIFPGDVEPAGMRCAAFQDTLCRAVKWCAGINPPATTPSDFPSPTAISLRAHATGVSGFGGPKAVTPFVNGVLPTLSVVPTGVQVTKAFPTLNWESPIEAKPWPGQPGQLMVVEMDGRVFKLTDSDATTTATPVLNITDRVWYINWDVGAPTHKHGGVFSTAFHPQFGQGVNKDFLYVYYVHHPANDSPDALVDGNNPFYNRLARFTWNGTAFTPASEQILLNLHDIAKGHEGGGMCFGPDGFLYLAFGDGGDESNSAIEDTQKLNERARSGVFRMDVDMQGGAISRPIRRQPAGLGSYSQNYYVPKSNPWAEPHEGATAAVLEEFYAIGLREPHRMSHDPASGFWIGDVGANTWEEVDLMDAPGLNFQWIYKEGTGNGYTTMPNPLIGIDRAPIHDYNHGIGNCIIGGHVYRGAAMPFLQGKYLFADNGTQNVYALEFDPVTKAKTGVQPIATGRAGGIWEGVSSFGIDSNGEPLLLQLGAGVNGAAQISRIKPAGPPGGGTWQYPPLLSQTGVFTNLSALTPAAFMIPFDVNMPLWSAGMHKKRWVILPNDGVANTAAERITYSATGNWQFPVGTVFVKHFARPDTDAPLETRLLVHGTDGWGGVTYKWRANSTEADLLEAGMEETLTVDGQTFEYLYPSRAQCNMCHTAAAGPVLGFRTRQLNRSLAYPGGGTANQIESLSVAGFINPALTVADLTNVLTSSSHDSPTVTDEAWVRSYLDSNCSHCHQPGGSSRAFWDARLTTPLPNQGILCGPVIDGLGAPAPAVVKAGSIENSIMLLRMNTIEPHISMPPLAKGIVDDEAVARVADWILGMDADSCTKSGSFYAGGEIGIPGPTPPNAHGPDLWHSNLVINENATYTNNTSSTISVALDRFHFNAGRIGDPVTPFVVKVIGNNNFTVVAIGTTRTNYVLGSNNVAFSDGQTVVPLAAGEKLAIGFIDAQADGSGGTLAGIVDWEEGGAEIWYSGGETDADAGSVTLGQAPDPGTELYTTLNRNYQFSISYLLSAYEIGHGAQAANGFAVDGANSNFVINETDTFINNSGAPMTVSVDRFRFHASRVGDPVTPFLVRVNANDNFTVVAIGTTRTGYSLGVNDVAFSSAPANVTIGAGEKIAAGFVDANADGTGGTGPGVISYEYFGTDQIFYSYDVTNVASSISLGQAPVLKGYPVTNLTRNYYYSVSLGFGGKADEDGDGLPDKWELAYSSTLTSLSGTADTDKDGMTDAEEHEAGTNPTNAASVLMALTVKPGAGGTTAIATVRTVPGRFYQLKVSTNLQTWTTAGTWKAASWPATTTGFVIPQSLLPPESAERLFLKVSPD